MLAFLLWLAALAIPVSGYVNRPAGELSVGNLSTFAGTVTIQHMERNGTADSIFVNGTVGGTITDTAGVESSLPETAVTHLYLRIVPQTSACNHIFFRFGDITGLEVGNLNTVQSRGLLIAEITGDSTLANNLCRVGWETAYPTKNSVRKIDQALTSINATLGG